MQRAVERFVTTALGALLLVTCAAATASAQNLNRVVIQVNDRIATLHDYQTRLEDFRRELAADQRLPLAERRQRMEELPDVVFSGLLDELLLLARADQMSVVFTEEEVDARLAQVRERYGFESDEEFAAALAQTGAELRKFREQMRLQMRINEVMAREVRNQIDVGEELARVYYRDHPEAFMAPRRLRLREVVVLEDGGLDAAARLQLAAAIRSDAAGGRTLEEIAAEHQEAGHTSGVIELGWVSAGDLAAELEAAVWELPPGGVSEPVASRGGLHVLKVVERQEEGLRPFNEVAEQARMQAANVAFAERAEAYLKQLEEQSYVRTAPPPEAADFRRARGQLPEEPTLPATAARDGEAAAGEDPGDEADDGGAANAAVSDN